MNSKKVGIFWVFLVALLMGFGCKSTDPDEEAIKAVVGHYATTLASGNKEGFREGLHPDYRDRFGHDRDTVTDRIFLIVREMTNIGVEFVGLEVENLDKDYGSARVHFKVRLTGEGKPRGYAWEEIKRRPIILLMRRMN